MIVGDLLIRRAGPEDFSAVVALLELTMGREASPLNAQLFDWKHRQNPFGPSPCWVACADGEIVGFRTFMNWEFLVRGEVVRAVRAVDTATHPDHQGRGIFTKLTLAALDDLRADGVRFVFNTPNDKSRPGYLKMGWHEVGKLPARVRLGHPAALVRIVRAKVPADIWSQASDCGVPALEALADGDAVERLLRSQPGVEGITTRLSVDHLRWRYGFEPLRYRAVVAPGGAAQGLVLMRVRKRGACTEAAVDLVLAPGGGRRAVRELAAMAARASGADYAIVIAQSSSGRSWARVPIGPVLTCRPLDDAPVPPLDAWQLTLGDVELF